ARSSVKGLRYGVVVDVVVDVVVLIGGMVVSVVVGADSVVLIVVSVVDVVVEEFDPQAARPSRLAARAAVRTDFNIRELLIAAVALPPKAQTRLGAFGSSVLRMGVTIIVGGVVDGVGGVAGTRRAGGAISRFARAFQRPIAQIAVALGRFLDR